VLVVGEGSIWKFTVSDESETLAVAGVNIALSVCDPEVVDVDVVHGTDGVLLVTDRLPRGFPSTVNCTVPVNVAKDLVEVIDAVSVTWVPAVAWESGDVVNLVLVVTVVGSCAASDCAAACLAAAALVAAVLAAARVAAAVLVATGLAAAGTGAAGLAGAG
jgi:hypothetical protein